MTTLLSLSLLFQSMVFAQASQMGCEDHRAGSSHAGLVMSADGSCCAEKSADLGSNHCQSEMGCHAFACVLADSFLMPQVLPVSSMQASISEGVQSRDLTEIWRPPTFA